MMSTYFGSITIVLKFPFTRAASTNGLHRYKGFDGGGVRGVVTTGDGRASARGNVADVGVGARLGRWARVIERLQQNRQNCSTFTALNGIYPMVLKNDMAPRY